MRNTALFGLRHQRWSCQLSRGGVQLQTGKTRRLGCSPQSSNPISRCGPYLTLKLQALSGTSRSLRSRNPRKPTGGGSELGWVHQGRVKHSGSPLLYKALYKTSQRESNLSKISRNFTVTLELYNPSGSPLKTQVHGICPVGTHSGVVWRTQTINAQETGLAHWKLLTTCPTVSECVYVCVGNLAVIALASCISRLLT